MASKTFHCRVVTPTNQVLSDDAVYASIPAWDGLFGVQPGRAPLVARLGLGELRLDFPAGEQGRGGSRSFYIDGGFVKVAEDDVIILAEHAIPVEAIAETDAKAELAEAEARTVPEDAADPAKAADEIRVARERARLKIRLAHRSRASGI